MNEFLKEELEQLVEDMRDLGVPPCTSRDLLAAALQRAFDLGRFEVATDNTNRKAW